MGLDDRILDLLAAHPGKPQSIEQLAAAIPEASTSTIRDACEKLRAERKLGRNGAGEAGRPFRFYLKQTLRRRKPVAEQPDEHQDS